MADIAVTAVMTPAAPAAGERVRVDINVRNNGPGSAHIVEVSFGSNDPLVVLSTSSTGSKVCSETPHAGAARCVGAMAPGEQYVMTATVVAPNRTDQPWLSSAGAFRGDETDADPTNNIRSFNVTLGDAPHADLSSSMTGPTIIQVETAARLTYQVRNDSAVATGPVYAGFNALGPAVLNGLPASGSGWQCTPIIASQAFCSRPSLAPGEVATIDVDVPTPRFTSRITLVARTFAEGIADPDPVDNVAMHAFDIATTLNFEPVLIPITRQTTGGAFGTIWKTETWMMIESFEPFDIQPRSCISGACVPLQLPFDPYAVGVLQPATQLEGQLVYVPAGTSERLRIETRVHDESRNSEFFGVEIPAVRTSRLTLPNSNTVLLNIPVTPEFRHTLRIYDPEPQPGKRIAIFAYAMGERAFFTTVSRFFEVPPDNNGGPFGLPLRPGYIQFSSDDLAIPAGVERIYYRIAPTDFTSRFWAFVSVTNNVTQEVTVITP